MSQISVSLRGRGARVSEYLGTLREVVTGHQEIIERDGSLEPVASRCFCPTCTANQEKITREEPTFMTSFQNSVDV